MEIFDNDYKELMFIKRHEDLKNKQNCKVKDKDVVLTTYETKQNLFWLKAIVRVKKAFKKWFNIPNSFKIIKLSDKSVGDLTLRGGATTIIKNFNGRSTISVYCDVKSECLRGIKG